ncbi:CDGSH iron-sulfur domain-containing protein 3, mitochondrial-like isoform X1 [Lineus longissimus]|uniref:CDGSH iron-sulfur domain-containing protein 3, mitochondrial-like isoform X1 n=1 Tax=Lineus longissimus TaxID=88925 RepID=UPI00315C5B26
MAKSFSRILAVAKLARPNPCFYSSTRLKTDMTNDNFTNPKYEGQEKERKHIETPKFTNEMDPNVVTLGKIYDKKPFRLELEAGKKYFWCACGHSRNQPFCDGSHKKLENFKPVSFTVDRAKKHSLCLCKRTSKAPFCDGTHRRSDEVKAAVIE